jgi:hypothetical protein
MADEKITIHITFKAGSAQLKNPEQDYEIAPAELDRLIDEMRAIDLGGSRRPTHPIGAYTVTRFDSGKDRDIQTRLVLRFEDVLYIG